MHILEAAMAANLQPYPLRSALPQTAGRRGASRSLVHLSAGLMAIAVFVIVLDLAAARAPVNRPPSLEQARVP